MYWRKRKKAKEVEGKDHCYVKHRVAYSHLSFGGEAAQPSPLEQRAAMGTPLPFS